MSAVEIPPCPPPSVLLGGEPGPVLVGFDFDGTLAPIASRPEGVRLEESAFEALARVGRLSEGAAPRVRAVVCSGRSLGDLGARVPANLDLIGSHGLQWRLRGIEQDWVEDSWWRWRESRWEDLTQAISQRGGELEDKRVSLTIHYRGAIAAWSDPGAHRWLLELAGGEVGLMPGIYCWNLVGRGKVPGMTRALPMTKGSSLANYARQRGFGRIIYFGDEPTDETVFGQTDPPVTGVRVIGEGGEAAEIETAARYAIRGVASVLSWLRAWAGHP